MLYNHGVSDMRDLHLQAPENNLGRSVSKASKARIRKALAHGAATLHAAAAQVHAMPCIG